MEPKDRIICALDVSDPHKALQLVEQLEPHVGLFKVGLELIYTSLGILLSGNEWEKREKEKWATHCLFERLSGRCFWDPKFHDISNTVQGASRALVKRLKPVMFNVHASGGMEAMRKVVQEKGNALALAVTILTSLSNDEVKAIYGGTAEEKVVFLVKQACEAGMDGIICSPQEIEDVKSLPLPISPLLVVPGTRPLWASANDQKRIMTPMEAIRAGADYLVVGRPITSPPNDIGGSVQAAQRIAEEIEEGMRRRS